MVSRAGHQLNPPTRVLLGPGPSNIHPDGLDWLAQLTTHIPDKNEQMVRYYGYYSNKSRLIISLPPDYGATAIRA